MSVTTGWRAVAVVGVGLLATAAGVAYGLRGRGEAAGLARSAREAVDARRLGDARRLIDRWVALRPRDAEPYYLRARVEVAAEDPQAALDALQRAVDRGYDPQPVLVLRAVLQARAGQVREAEPVLRRAFARGDGPRREVDEGLARVDLASFRLAEAATVLDRWMKDAPDDPRPYLWRNEIDTRGNAEPAVIIRNYREALRRDPGRADARLALANKLREARRLDEAEAEYAALLARDPKNVDGHTGAGQNALQQGDIQAAVRHFTEALSLQPREPVALRELALIDLRDGRAAQARDRLKTVVEADPYDPEVRASYARALRMAGDESRAREEAAVTERLRQDQRRMADLRNALVKNPGDLNLRSEAARWLLEHGHEPEGLEWTRLILRDHPNHPPTCRLLADHYAKAGNVGLANYYRVAASGSQDR